MFEVLAIALGLNSQPASLFEYDPSRDAIGRIYYYERSNRDGSMPVRVTVYRQSSDTVLVYKESALCEQAGHVTGYMDMQTGQALSLIGGQLLPGAEYRDFAWTEYHPDAETAHLRVDLGDIQIDHTEPLPGDGPWMSYGFDLSGLTITTPHLADPEGMFAMDVSVLWPPDAPERPFHQLGETVFEFDGTAEIHGQTARRYDVTGGLTGTLWLDYSQGHILAADFDQPNHPGYTDFRMDLVGISDGGLDEWTALLEAHFEGCD